MSNATPDRSAMLAATLLAAGLACAAATTVLVHHRPHPAIAGRPLPYADIPLRDQNGVNRTLAFWSGRLVVLDFIFAGCGDTCPIKTSQLADVQQSLDPAMRDRIQFVSVTIDPEHDTPAALAAYAARNGADLANWTFLTGDLANVASFAANFDAELENDADVANHITTIRLLDTNARILQRYVGEPVDQMRLLRDIAAHSPQHDPGLASTPIDPATTQRTAASHTLP